MKILKIIHTPGHGGAENTFRWLAWGLKQEGQEVVAVVPEIPHPSGENWIGPALQELEIPQRTFDTTGSPLQTLKVLSRLIAEEKPTIVHSHLLDSNFYASLACRIQGVPHLCTEHGDISLADSFTKRVKYALISLCSQKIVCVSKAVEEKTRSRLLRRRGLTTIYNGIKLLKKQTSTFRDEFRIPSDAILIGNVGNLYPVKGQSYLLRAFAEICQRFPQAYMVIVGRGEEEDRLRQLCAELQLPEKQIILTGFRQDVENILNSLDLYVQSSLSEGHPLAVLEAMSLGLPVLLTAVGGNPEVAEHGQYATLVPPGDSSALAKGILAFIEHPQTHIEQAQAAQLRAQKEFSIEQMVRNYLACYRELAGAHPKGEK